MTRSQIRKTAKDLGYKLQFKTNSFNQAYIAIGFVHDKGTTLGSNCFPSSFMAKHTAIFEYLESIKGNWLTDTEQKIV